MLWQRIHSQSLQILFVLERGQIEGGAEHQVEAAVVLAGLKWRIQRLKPVKLTAFLRKQLMVRVDVGLFEDISIDHIALTSEVIALLVLDFWLEDIVIVLLMLDFRLENMVTSCNQIVNRICVLVALDISVVD